MANFYGFKKNGTTYDVKDKTKVDWVSNAVLGAKNLALANRATTQTISLMDFTVNSSDVNVVTVNGTNSAEVWFNYMDIELPEGDYIGSGCTNGSDTTYMLSFVIRNAGNTGDETTIKCFNGDVNITVPSGGRHVRAFIVVRNGKTLTNQLFKLMIRPASDPDDTYAPFAMTNKQLTDAVTPVEVSYDNTTVNANIDTVACATLRKIGNVNQIRCRFTVGSTQINGWSNLLKIPGAPSTDGGNFNGGLTVAIYDHTTPASSGIFKGDVYQEYVRLSPVLTAEHQYSFDMIYLSK